jgi:heat-inducible transcriptional repressor
MLSERSANILKIIIDEYVLTTMPIGSETIANKYNLGVSSATIRNEISRLEKDGYVIRRHISGGSVPSDKGYRYYVEHLMQKAEISTDEQLMVSHLFHQVERELEQWTRLAAALLARMGHNLALVTFPKAMYSSFGHIDLVSLQESTALLILLLQEARLKHQIIAFNKAVTQEDLNAVSRELNDLLCGLTWSQILAYKGNLSLLASEVRKTIVEIMSGEDKRSYEEPYIEGLRNIVTQPEFTESKEIIGIVDVLENKGALKALLPEVPNWDGVHVVIGGENREDMMRGCSMVLTLYGIPGEVKGALGIIGPTRMQYGRAVSSVRYLGSVMSNLVGELHKGRE